MKLGAFLLKVLSNDILNEHGDPVFRFYYVPLLKKTGTKFQGCFEMEKSSFERINKTSDGNFITNIRYLPMLLPPCKWDNRDYYGSYLLLKPPIMKHVSRAQVQAVQKAKMNEVNVGLDYLGSIPWRINTSLYDIINQCIEKNLLIGEIPSYQNLNIPTLEEYMASLPSELKASSSQDYLTNSYRYHRRRILQKNSELHSLRCDLSLKLSVAKEFLNDIIYFPHNLDFRGRAYPIPPNLNHIGSDLSRSLLLFHTKKPLGVNGLKWLKIHLCNLFGNNKISFDKREEYINKHIHDVYESAKTPFEGKMWWSTAEKPFQALATCMEIVKAIESGDPVNFESNFPVHQDGSCNGLQHYAGLGKDKDGGIAVNLVDGDIPSDVYTRVLDIVHKVMDEDSKIDANDADPLQRKKGEIARAIQRFVNRKTIKQTVMTSVYGVTFIGARSQGKTRIFSIHYCYSYFSCCLVQARLEEAWLKDKFGVEGTEGPKMISQQDEEFLYEAAGYLGRLTLKSLEQMFHSARGIMDWLAEVSKRISMEGQVMSWITPLGLPVMQPYREESHYMVKTALQSILVTRDDETLPVSKRKQRTAFPPNFVHSLDATHMMMTCLKMKNAHKTFAAVHDSYWTHPCDVEFMNKVRFDHNKKFCESL